jgi:ADP-ribose pyrophosphatase YjhB (NUDIX family)
MRFCPACGGAIERRQPDGDSFLRHVCAACGTIHYLNPKVVVGAVCRWQDRVLLCRRAIEPRADRWTVPAGFLELGESLEQGARREAAEEAKARIAITGLLGIYDVVRLGQVLLFYRARLLDAAVEAGAESLEVGLFGWAEIPWRELAFPSVEWVLRRAEAVWDAPDPVVPARGP